MDGLLVLQALRRQVRQTLQVCHVLGHLFLGNAAQLVRHVQHNHIDHRQLGAVSLVEATAISGPAQVYSTSSLSLAMVLPTTLTMDRMRQLGLGHAQGGQGVGCLAGLADDNDQGVLI